MSCRRPVWVALPLIRHSLGFVCRRGEASGAAWVWTDVPSGTSPARGSPARSHPPRLPPDSGARGMSLLRLEECDTAERGGPFLGNEGRCPSPQLGLAASRAHTVESSQQAHVRSYGGFSLGAPGSGDGHGKGGSPGKGQGEWQCRVWGTARVHSGSRTTASNSSIAWHWAPARSTCPYTTPHTSTASSKPTITDMRTRGMGSAASAALLDSLRKQIKGTRENPPLATSFDGKQRRDNRQEVGYQVVRRGAPTASLGSAGSVGGAGEPEGDAGPGRSLGLQPVQAVKKAVFAVVQVGSHQFKVTPGDVIYTEKLLFADLNDTVHLDRVLLLGSRHETIIGRPSIPGAHVVALVEEQAQDAKVIVFKKKRRKNYRRHQGHRQELTRLFIVDIHGIEESLGVAIDAGEGAGTRSADAEGLSAAVGP